MRLPSSAQQKSLASQVEAAEQHLETVQPYLTSRGISEETARRFRLGYDPADNRLVIPYLTPVGAWSVKRRCIAEHNCKDEGHGKYVYDSGAEVHLYNAQTLLEAEFVVVTEGELDAVTCEQAGIPAVAYPGASTWSKMRHWRWCFDSAQEVVVIADGDDPGVKAAGEVASSLRDAVAADVRTVKMPAGFDANRFVVEYGESELLYLLGWIE